MQHTNHYFFFQLLKKPLCFLILFFVYTTQTVAQKDTAQPKKNVITNILNRITGGKKDTLKPVQTNPNRNVVTAKDTLPKRDVITNPNIFNDKNIIVQVRFPDTLEIGAYSIVVEEYDKGGVWNNSSKLYEHLNGIGRIKFNCLPVYSIWPGIWKNAVMKPVKMRVVDKPIAGENEISVKDAASLGLATQPGSDVAIDMPHFNDKAIDISRYIKDIKGIKPPAPEGIRVRFTDCSVSVVKAGATKGDVLSGIAKYPTEPAIPAVPFTLNISPGFQLEVSAISFSPGSDPLVTARLVLPSSITQNIACAAGRLDLGNFRLSPTCEFYKELPGNNYGVFGIGNTTLAIGGRGYVVDFSSSLTYGPSGKPATWKGVTLIQGESRGSPSGSVVSNIGYLQADYTFSNGIIESGGLTANFRNTAPYGYGATQPYGYLIEFDNAIVNVESSLVAGGTITQGKITLPKTAVRQSDNSEVVLVDANITIKPGMDLVGYSIIRPGVNVYWGDLIAAGGGNRKSFGVENMDRMAWLFFSAQAMPAFNPTTTNGKKFNAPFGSLNAAVVESNKMQGASFGNFEILVVNTPNVPSPLPPDVPKINFSDNPVWFRLNKKDFCWMNVMTEGVHCSIRGDIMESPGLKLGDPVKPLYVGVTPFETLTMDPDRQKNPKPFSSILLQCVESAVITCDFRSHIKLPDPVGDILSFKEMVFTSTSNNAGGKLELKPGDSLAYWGLQLVPKPGFSNAGLVSVKTGQIILTAAGLAETRHFAQPFWLTWGEMLANGSMGRLFFDYNSAGQQFDKFNYTHNAVALSAINPDPSKKGFLRVGGTAFFPFFGGDYLHIIDTYTPGMSGDPFNGRTITLSSSTTGSFLPSDFTIGGNWSDGLGIFNFTIQYASVKQDGFVGDGTSLLRNLVNSSGGGGGGGGGSGGAGGSYPEFNDEDRITADGDIGSTLDMSSRGTCIRIGSNLMDMRSISLGSIANASQITRIWGCVCIINDGIENLVVGGEITTAASYSVHARVGSYLSAILQVNPSLARLTVDGVATLSIALSLDAEVNGHMQLTMNFAEGFLEGEVSGKIKVGGGTGVFGGGSLQAEGQLNWHLGIDFIELQGMVGLKMMASAGIPGLGAGAGMGITGAFYIGKNAPKSRAWVLVGGDPRFSMNMTPMPDRLTGVYGSLHVEQGINIAIISGGYEITVGFGAFILEPSAAASLGAFSPGIGLPYVVGNLGGRVHGEILGGLVSAGAYFNLSIICCAPFGFEGKVGLEACVLWVACGSIDVTIGLNSTEGFYIR